MSRTIRKALSQIFLALLFIVFMGCDKNKNQSTPSDGCGKTQESGTFDGNITVNSEELNYKMIVPQNYDPSTPYSLVFGFHGSAFSNNPDTMISLTSSMRTAANDNAIFIYPDGHINGVPNYWEKNEDGKDIQFFDELLAKLKSNYCINSSKIFVVGFSDGGGMVNSLGCYRSALIRGAAEASGYLPQKNKCGDSSMPFFIWHGRADTITNFTTYAVPEIDHWETSNGCSDATSPIPPTSEECVSYNSCSKAPLVVCTPNVDHGFPNTLGEPIWNFFESL